MSRLAGVLATGLFLLGTAGGSGPAQAGFSEALELTRAAQSAEDRQTAWAEVKSCADELDTGCLYLSGIYYWNGWVVERNHEKAVANFRFAANQNYVPAQLMMGHALRLGQGTVRSLEAAMGWYRRALMTGAAEAEYAWAIIHWAGIRENGVFPRQFDSLDLAPPDELAENVWGATGQYRGEPTEEPLALSSDPSISIAYLQMAAERGHPHAMAVLGRSYAVGQITERDIERATGLLAAAARQGDGLGVKTLAGMILQKRIEPPYPIPLKTLLGQLEEVANAGDIIAHYLLGRFYLTDDWGIQDRLQAELWMKRAGDMGLQSGARVAEALEQGASPQDLIRGEGGVSLGEVRDKAEAGDATAQFQMGEVYRRGLAGQARDFAKAGEWYEKAAAKDHANGLAALATLNLYGFGREVDVERALELYRRAARQNDDFAARMLAMVERTLKANPSFPFQAVKILEGQALRGEAEAAELAANYFYQGLGVLKDLEKARELYRQAADAGRALAAYNAGQMAMLGEGGGEDLELAHRYFEKSAANGFALGQYWAGRFNLEGRGGPKDQEAAAAYFQQAADQENAGALYALAVLHENGTGVDRSMSEAANCYQRAARQGHLGAQLRLGAILAEGKSGVPRDLALSYFWFQVARPQLAQEGQIERVEKSMRALEQRMQPDLLDQVRRNAAKWQPEAGD